MVYLQKYKWFMNDNSYPISFSKAISVVNSAIWMNVMEDELASMHHNDV